MPKNQDDYSVLLSLTRHILTQVFVAPSFFSKNRTKDNIKKNNFYKTIISEYSNMSADNWSKAPYPIGTSALIVSLILFKRNIDLITRAKLGESVLNNPAITAVEKIALVLISIPIYAISAVVRAPINLASWVSNKLMGASPKSNASEQDPLTTSFSTNTQRVDTQIVKSLEERQSTSCEAPSITTLRQGEDNDSMKKPQ